ncbi:MAG TPA: hypothetical protein VD859_16950, partial [Nocardioides sp.]|nr:hypothetical protein [Nocardioides sp.]
SSLVQPDDHPANPPPSGPSGGIAQDRLGGHAVVPPGPSAHLHLQVASAEDGAICLEESAH